MRHPSTTVALTVLQSSALMLLLLLGAHCVSADYAPCSDPATCGAVNNCCTTVNGANYCCPGADNSLDFNTKRCANFAQCALPTYGVIAVWPTAGCLGEATYQQYRMGGGTTTSDCLDVTSRLASSATHGTIVVSASGTSPWSVRQYRSASECANRNSNNYNTRAVSEQYDASCYNFKDGSFSVYLPAQPSAPTAGSSISYPPVHSMQYTTPPVATTASQVSLALWTNSANCLSGTAFTSTVTQGGCFNTAGDPGANNMYSYTLSCASKTTTSAWTLTPFTLTGCQPQLANPPIQGTGAVCVAIGLWGGSAFIDCATQASGKFFNYLPLTDGGWNSTYGECVGACGGATGTQTRTCTAPAPSGGGAACVGEASRSCTTSACDTPAASTGSSDQSSTGSAATSSGGSQPPADVSSSSGAATGPGNGGDANSAASSLPSSALGIWLAIGTAGAAAVMSVAMMRI